MQLFRLPHADSRNRCIDWRTQNHSMQRRKQGGRHAIHRVWSGRDHCSGCCSSTAATAPARWCGRKRSDCSCWWAGVRGADRHGDPRRSGQSRRPATPLRPGPGPGTVPGARTHRRQREADVPVTSKRPDLPRTVKARSWPMCGLCSHLGGYARSAGGGAEAQRDRPSAPECPQPSSTGRRRWRVTRPAMTIAARSEAIPSSWAVNR